MTQKKITVGTGPRDYIAFRTFQEIPTPGVQILHRPYLPIRALARVHPAFSKFCHGIGYFLPSLKSYDLLHSSNAILLNHEPWVVSFESTLPRIWEHPWLYKKTFEKLASNYCKKILPMSFNAKKQFELRNAGERDLDDILNKVTVHYPAVEDSLALLAQKQSRALMPPYKLIFIGNDFFRKGGPIACKVFETLKNHFEIELTVISNMQLHHPYKSTSYNDVLFWTQEMQRLGVTHLKNLSMLDVRKQISHADLQILPTLQDSFGFSIIEAMATEVPSIATAIEAIPEIITDKISGCLVRVPTDMEDRLSWNSGVEEELQHKFVETVTTLLTDPTQLTYLGKKARQRYEDNFHPDVVGRKLRSIYDEALNSS